MGFQGFFSEEKWPIFKLIETKNLDNKSYTSRTCVPDFKFLQANVLNIKLSISFKKVSLICYYNLNYFENSHYIQPEHYFQYVNMFGKGVNFKFLQANVLNIKLSISFKKVSLICYYNLNYFENSHYIQPEQLLSICQYVWQRGKLCWCSI